MSAPVTLVLGLGRGVGLACARRFVELGHQVLVAGPNSELLTKVERELGEDAAVRQCELHTTLGLKNVFAGAAEAYGPADNMVVVPPLVSSEGGLMTADYDAVDRALARTARAAVLSIRLFAEQVADRQADPAELRDRSRQRGAITFVLSLSSRLADPGRFMEAFTQSAVEGAVRAAAIDLAPQRIRCNAISAIRPRAEDDEPWLKTRTPLRRAALADEIADAAAYLASPSAAFVTGQTLVLDGGRLSLGGVLEG